MFAKYSKLRLHRVIPEPEGFYECICANSFRQATARHLQTLESCGITPRNNAQLFQRCLCACFSPMHYCLMFVHRMLVFGKHSSSWSVFSMRCAERGVNGLGYLLFIIIIPKRLRNFEFHSQNGCACK